MKDLKDWRLSIELGERAFILAEIDFDFLILWGLFIPMKFLSSSKNCWC